MKNETMSMDEANSFYRSHPWKKHRKQLLDAMGSNPFECAICGNTLARSEVVVDHIVGIRAGGSRYDYANLQIVDKSCNSRKRSNIFVRQNYFDKEVIKL